LFVSDIHTRKESGDFSKELTLQEGTAMGIKLRVTKDKILEGLQRVQNVVSVRSTLPILSNVLLQAEEEAVWLTTTDLDVAIRCRVEAEVAKVGSTTLPARKLFLILKEVVANDIEIEVDEKHAASIRCGGSYFKIMGLPEEEYPRFPQISGGKSLKLEAGQQRSLMHRTAFAASNDETRYVLNGVFMSFKEGKQTVVATDGRRLALAESECDLPKGTESEFIVPSKAVVEMGRLLSEKGEAALTIGENQLIISLGSTTLCTKLIEGSYPNFRQVIPTEAKERIPLEREKLLGSLQRAALLTNEKTQAVKLAFAKDKLTISANTPEVGESRETMAINYKGKELAIAFNPQYLMEPLRNLDADEVFLELTDELSPGVLKITEPFLYVLMPMRLS
jgi:DNA polymerase-3 subunit beta